MVCVYSRLNACNSTDEWMYNNTSLYSGTTIHGIMEQLIIERLLSFRGTTVVRWEVSFIQLFRVSFIRGSSEQIECMENRCVGI